MSFNLAVLYMLVMLVDRGENMSDPLYRQGQISLNGCSSASYKFKLNDRGNFSCSIYRPGSKKDVNGVVRRIPYLHGGKRGLILKNFHESDGCVTGGLCKWT